MKSFKQQAEAIVLNALSFCNEGQKNKFKRMYPNGLRFDQMDHAYAQITSVLDHETLELLDQVSIIYDDELDIMCVVKGNAHQAVKEIQDTVDIDEVETALHDKGFEILHRNDIVFGEEEPEDEEDEQRRRDEKNGLYLEHLDDAN